MNKKNPLETVIKVASKISDRKLARKIRISAAQSIFRTAERGSLQYFQGKNDWKTRQHYLAERGGELPNGLYGVGIPEREDADLSEDKWSKSLSTRYSPDRVGVQAVRVGDGIVQDPITNKVYDWNDGFKTEDGETFGGSGVSLQTDIMYRK